MKQTKSKWPMFIGLALLIAIGAAGYSELSSSWISKTLTGLFGPPKVTLQETFSENPAGPTFDHSSFDMILQESVDGDGWVDYAKIKTNVSKLDAYIETIGTAHIEPLGRNEKLAFLINSYNALTLKLIVEKYPLDSIKEIPMRIGGTPCAGILLGKQSVSTKSNTNTFVQISKNPGFISPWFVQPLDVLR